MNVLMITESNFPVDTRVSQEAFTLAKHGHKISVIALRNEGQLFCETIDNVKVYRIPKIQLFKGSKHYRFSSSVRIGKYFVLAKGIIGYGFEFMYFTLASFVLTLFAVAKDRIKVIHAHNPPDTLVFVALPLRPYGVRFVFDHHDLSPDLFLEKYGQQGSLVYRLLLLLEKLSCNTADMIITTNESYKSIEMKRCGATAEKICVVRNGPDLNKIKAAEPIKSIREKGKTILCYLGTINVQDGVQYLLDVFAKLVHKHKRRDILLLIIGDGDYLGEIRNKSGKLDIEEYVIFTGWVLDKNEVNRYLSTADIFVDAAPYSFLNDNSTFIKHMEYMIFKKPVVSFALKESMYTLGNAGVFITPNDLDKMAQTIIELIGDEPRRRLLGESAKLRVAELSWDRVSAPLVEGYAMLGRI